MWVKPMEKNAVYFGGSDFGRFVPTYMVFVESQQDDRWKVEPGFDRRDVTVITQNALCDTFYCHYIRDQYDARFRPRPDQYTPFEKWLGRDTAYPKEPVTCISEAELNDCWLEFEKRPEVAERMREGGPVLREDSNDVFEINGIVAWQIFQKNKATHAFYLEQSVAIPWMYPYMLPSGTDLQAESGAFEEPCRRRPSMRTTSIGTTTPRGCWRTRAFAPTIMPRTRSASWPPGMPIFITTETCRRRRNTGCGWR